MRRPRAGPNEVRKRRERNKPEQVRPGVLYFAFKRHAGFAAAMAARRRYRASTRLTHSIPPTGATRPGPVRPAPAERSPKGDSVSEINPQAEARCARERYETETL